MASASKPSRSRKLPSPRNKELPSNGGRLSSKYFSSQQAQNGTEITGALDVLGAYSTTLYKAFEMINSCIYFACKLISILVSFII